MKSVLIPILLAALGLGAGAGAGFFLGDDPAADVEGKETSPAEKASGDVGGKSSEGPEAGGEGGDKKDVEFARLSNQFIIPVVSGETVEALVVLSITLETTPGGTEIVFQNEPRLRDRFLRVLFDHANIGGFGAGFTQAGTMTLLRNALLESARNTLGESILDVLIVDIVRQEV